MNTFEVAYDSMGIYPRSVNGKDRTEWQEGWNAYGGELLNRVIRIDEWIKQFSEEDAELIKELVEDDTVFLAMHDGKPVGFNVLCNDFFHWGCADAEECELEDLPAIKENSALWLCKKRNMQPQAPVIKYLKEEGLWTEEMESFPLNPDQKK